MKKYPAPAEAKRQKTNMKRFSGAYMGGLVLMKIVKSQ